MSTFLSGVEILEIQTFVRPLENEDDIAQWLDLFHVFSRVEQLRITGKSNPDFACALQLVSAEMAADVLPALRKLTLSLDSPKLREVKSFISTHNSASFPTIVLYSSHWW